MAVLRVEWSAVTNNRRAQFDVTTDLHKKRKSDVSWSEILLNNHNPYATLWYMSPTPDPTIHVMEALNETLKAELTAVYQYLLHAKVCQNWGYHRLAEVNRHESIEELAHAEALIDRILFLSGVPRMNDLAPIKQCTTVKEQLENDLALEMDAISRLNSAVKTASEAGDHVSRQLFDKILADEDHHVDYLEGQLHIIEEVGLENYLAQQIHKSHK
jgi:bacterioferritin